MSRAHTVVIVLATLAVAPSALAATKRVRVRVDSLPRQDKPITINASDAVLPNGMRDGSPVPKSWKIGDPYDAEYGDCTDDRRASVEKMAADEVSTEKIWEANGKVFFDRAQVKVVNGKLWVTSAERTPVVYVTENIWAYRSGTAVALVFGTDNGVIERGISFGCSVSERLVSYPTGSTVFGSSPDRATEAKNMLALPKKTAPWKGVAFTGLATVSKSAADDAVMLNLVIRMP